MKIPILIDTDMAIDDWLAIIYLLRHPEADVRAITVAATGEAHAGPGVANARRLLALAKYHAIPVAAGSPFPLVGKRAFPFFVRWVMDMHMFLPLPAPLPKRAGNGKNAVDVMVEVLKNAADPVTIVALGPLTNLAQVFQRFPHLAGQVAQIVIMGGALDVPGNLGTVDPFLKTNLHAEWNIYIDPHAANIVFNSGAPILLVPLDATNMVPLTGAFLEEMASAVSHPAAIFSQKALARIFQLSNGREFYFWDPLAAAAAMDPGILGAEPCQLRVIEEPGEFCGRVVKEALAAPSEKTVRAATRADRSAFEHNYLEILKRT